MVFGGSAAGRLGGTSKLPSLTEANAVDLFSLQKAETKITHRANNTKQVTVHHIMSDA